jgi:hypothetical protein
MRGVPFWFQPILVPGHFLPQIYQNTHCTNLEYFSWYRILIGKNIIATEMKENG